jgi:3-oxoacyl-[acyl-carrier protein] reductase
MFLQLQKNNIDTSNVDSVKKFLQIHNQTDILIPNTGGHAPKQFLDITEDDWKLDHNQLFLGFCTILQNIKINDNGYIFLISSNVIKESNPKLIISSAYRAAFRKIQKVGKLSNSEFLYENTISLSLHEELSEKDQHYICSIIKNI